MKNSIHKSKKALYDWEKESLFDSQEDFSSIPNNKNYIKEYKLLFKYEYQNFNSKIFISKNNDDIYYLYKYLPISCYNRVPEDFKKNELIRRYKNCSNEILSYKNNDNQKIYNNFTYKLMYAVVNLLDVVFKDIEKIALVSVPSSNPDNVPQTKTSVNIIEKIFKESNLENILDSKYNNIIVRNEKILSQKESMDKWDIDRQKNSLSCEKNLPESIGFIILDDIVTTGTTISACKELLISNGANEKNIVGLTIAETILCRNLKWSNKKVVFEDNAKVLYEG